MKNPSPGRSTRTTVRKGAGGAPRRSVKQPDSEMKNLLHALELQGEELRRAVAELDKERKRYADLFEFAPVGYLVLDARGIIRQANLAAASLLRAEHPGLPGVRLSTFIARRALPTLRKMLVSAKGGGQATCEVELASRSSEVLWLRVEAAGIHNGLQKLSLVDITDRRQAEDALRASQARFEMAADASSDGIWDWDDLRTPRIWWSPRFAALLGYRPDDLDPTLDMFFELLHPEDRDRIRRQLPARLLATESFESEYRLRTKSGEYRWFSTRGKVSRSSNGVPVRMIGSIRDITQSKNAADLLLQSERKYRALVQNIPDLIIRWDLNMRMLYVSPAIEKIFGISASACIGRTNSDMGMPPDSIALWDAKIGDVLETRSPVSYEFNFPGLAGLGHFSATVVPELDESGNVDSLLSVVRDITEQKRAQKALGESEKSYRTLLDTLQEGIWTVDVQGVTTFVNPAMAKMLGYRQEEMVGRPFFDFMDAAGLASARTILAEGVSGVSGRHPFTFLRKDGTPVASELLKSPLYADDGAIVGGISSVMDITDRTAAEEAYRSLVDNSLQGLAIFQKRRIVFCNQAFAEMTGFSVSELISLSREETAGRVHPDDRERVLALMRALLMRNAVPPVNTFRYVHKSGVTRQVETFATLVAYRGSPAVQITCRDISERHQVEVALRESEERFRSIFYQSPVGATIVSLEYRFMRVNDALCRITGYSVEELLARRFPDITHPDDLAMDIALIQRLVVGEIDHYSLDKRYIRKTGEPVWVRLSVGLIRDESNNPAYFLSMIEDISDRKQAETELTAMRDKLRNLAVHLLSAREEERRRIAQEMHDELGQALTAMKMDLRWVEKKLDPGAEPLKEKVRGLVGQADQTISMVQRITAEIRPRMLDDLGLAAALDWLGKDFTRRTSIRCDVSTDFPEALVGGNAASTLYRIAQEALTNVARHATARTVSILLRKTGNFLELRVKDDGVGITAEQIANQTSYGILGIRERAQGLGGSLSIGAEKNHGTIVAVTVPLPVEGGLA